MRAHKTDSLNIKPNNYVEIAKTIDENQKRINHSKLSILIEWCYQLNSLLSESFNVDLKVFERAITSFEHLFIDVEKLYCSKLSQLELKLSMLNKLNLKLEKELETIKAELNKPRDTGQFANMINKLDMADKELWLNLSPQRRPILGSESPELNGGLLGRYR